MDGLVCLCASIRLYNTTLEYLFIYDEQTTLFPCMLFPVPRILNLERGTEQVLCRLPSIKMDETQTFPAQESSDAAIDTPHH